MRRPKQVYDEVYKELLDEFGIKDIEGKPRTLKPRIIYCWTHGLHRKRLFLLEKPAVLKLLEH